MPLHIFPTINASLNLTVFILLFCGWISIKRGRKDIHKRFMIAALACSAFFLCSYLTYHYLSPGVTRYAGEGWLRILYFVILLTHTPLAAIIIPFCLTAVYHAVHQNYQKHTAITKWLLPVWMYVSITGVLIYLMLYVF